MKLTFATLAIAVQLAGTAALAQTSDGTTGTGATTTLSGSFGSDWSMSLASAIFGEDKTTVRPDSEIQIQWQTLSEEDRSMLRRDCMMFMQEAGGSGDAKAAGSGPLDGTGDNAMSDTTGANSDTDTTGMADGTGDIGTADMSADMMNISAENMQAICAATADL